jgi:hypothetical protein
MALGVGSSARFWLIASVQFFFAVLGLRLGGRLVHGFVQRIVFDDLRAPVANRG